MRSSRRRCLFSFAIFKDANVLWKTKKKALVNFSLIGVRNPCGCLAPCAVRYLKQAALLENVRTEHSLSADRQAAGRFGTFFCTSKRKCINNNQNAFVAVFNNTGSPRPSFLSGSNCVLASPTTSHTILFVSRYLLESDLIFSTVLFGSHWFYQPRPHELLTNGSQ